MNKHDTIQQFIRKCRSRFGRIPKFLHTTTDDSINYSGPSFDDDEIIAILDSVLFGEWLSVGEKVHQFERAFSERFGHRQSVMVNSGSSANLLMIAALKKHFGWRDGDEIVLSVVGFPTTLSAVVANNLKPVFVDIEWDTLNFDLDKAEKLVHSGTKAIFLSPVLGNPPDMDGLIEICGAHGVMVVLDDCDSLGSSWRDKYLTDYAVASSCSFYASHHLCTLQGGMVSSNVKHITDIVRSMASWGRDCSCVGIDNLLSNGSCGRRFGQWIPEIDTVIDHRYIFTNMGYNLNPLDLQGAIGLEQLKKFDSIYTRRIRNKRLIWDYIAGALPDVTTTVEYAESSACWFGVPIICPDKEYKAKLVAHLEKNRIQTRNYFAGNILLHGAYRHLGNWKDYPQANQVLDRVFFIGCSPNYNQNNLLYIKEVFEKFGLWE